MKKLVNIILGINFLAISHLGFAQINCQPLQIDREKLLEKIETDLTSTLPPLKNTSTYAIKERQSMLEFKHEIAKELVYSDACHPKAKILTIDQIISHPIASDPLLKAQQFKKDFWLAYNSAKYDPQFLREDIAKNADEKRVDEDSGNFLAKYGEDGIKLYGNIKINPLQNGDLKKEAAFVQKVIDYYIHPNDDYKQTEQLLRNAGFEVNTDLAHFPGKLGVYSGNSMMASVQDTTKSIFITDINIKVVPTDKNYKNVKNIEVWIRSRADDL